MKKIVSIVLALCLCLSLCACGKSKAAKAAEEAITAIGEVTLASGEAIANAEKLYGILTDTEKSQVDNRLELVEAREAFTKLQGELIYANAKKAYEQLNEVAEMCVNGMDSIYGAWYFGVYKRSDASSSGIFYSMAAETPNFSGSELEEAANSLGLSGFKVKSDWQYCLWVVEAAIEIRGDYAQIQESMAQAERILQELTEEYDDYTYYPKLKELYAAVNSYVTFYTSPSGSFKQLADTINNYENNIRTLQSDVGFLFNK